MKIDVSEKIKDLYGTPYASPRSTPKGVIYLTAAEVYITALLGPTPQPIPYEQCKERVELADRLKDAEGETELEDREIEILKGLVPITNNLPLIVAKAVGLLEKEG